MGISTVKVAGTIALDMLFPGEHLDLLDASFVDGILQLKIEGQHVPDADECVVIVTQAIKTFQFVPSV